MDVYTAMPDNWAGCYGDPYAVARIKKAVKLLDPQYEQLVLDIGCYREEAAKYLPRNVRYAGIDSEQWTEEVIKLNIDGGFTWPTNVSRILCLETLEHLVNPAGTLASMREHLSHDGVCIVSLPNEATLFHRLRSLLGTVDAECFSHRGKHLHLPSLAQCRRFLGTEFLIESETYYISPAACGSRQEWLGIALKLIPDKLWQGLADMLPSLFARGFIFKCRVKPPELLALNDRKPTEV